MEQLFTCSMKSVLRTHERGLTMFVVSYKWGNARKRFFGPVLIFGCSCTPIDCPAKLLSFWISIFPSIKINWLLEDPRALIIYVKIFEVSIACSAFMVVLSTILTVYKCRQATSFFAQDEVYRIIKIVFRLSRYDIRWYNGHWKLEREPLESPLESSVIQLESKYSGKGIKFKFALVSWYGGL